MIQKMEVEPATTLFLVLEKKSVNLLFDQKGYLLKIGINVNKFVELTENKSVTEDSIFHVKDIVLLTMNNHKTRIPVKAHGNRGTWHKDKVFQKNGFFFEVEKGVKIHTSALRYR
ncbi:hypothetical protein [Enterococcus sp. AZ163]|uniref:hypothetical protein n=1 Tax=Enterococcus sp. AZ163 TaxID=2774638 RepID=UPI003D2E780E